MRRQTLHDFPLYFDLVRLHHFLNSSSDICCPHVDPSSLQSSLVKFDEILESIESSVLGFQYS